MNEKERDKLRAHVASVIMKWGIMEQMTLEFTWKIAAIVDDAIKDALEAEGS